MFLSVREPGWGIPDIYNAQTTARIPRGRWTRPRCTLKCEGPPVGGPSRIKRCLAGFAVDLELRHVRERTARLVRVGARPAARRDQLLAQHREAEVADVRRARSRLDEVDPAAVRVAERAGLRNRPGRAVRRRFDPV